MKPRSYTLHLLIIDDETGEDLINIGAMNLPKSKLIELLDIAKPTHQVVPDIEPQYNPPASLIRPYKKSKKYKHSGGRREVPIVPPADFDPTDLEGV